MKNMIEQIVKIMPDECRIHLGLDEARYDKKITLMVWADHGGRPVPENIKKEIIIMPWNYWNVNRKDIDKRIAEYSGRGKSAWMPGTGMSAAQPRGAFHATRYWAKKCLNSPNIEGIDITSWETNNLEQKLIGLFAGSYYLWNPSVSNEFFEAEDYEEYDSKVFPVMQWWQDKFRDARPDNILRDRGPFVQMGYYLWGKKHMRPVAPTALSALTLGGHDFINE